MGREIELKLPLTEEQFSKILSGICQKSKIGELRFEHNEILIKSDEYFSQYKNHQDRLQNEPRVIRLRTEKNCGFISDFDFFASEMPTFPQTRDFLKKLACTDTEKRSAKTSAVFTIKNKKIEGGIEFNNEDETELSDPDTLRKFFLGTKFDCWFKKEKYAFSSYCPKAHLELEIVNGLPYVEIEYTNDDLQSEEVKDLLENIVRTLGLDPKNTDKRSWVEIISQTNGGQK